MATLVRVDAAGRRSALGTPGDFVWERAAVPPGDGRTAARHIHADVELRT